MLRRRRQAEEGAYDLHCGTAGTVGGRIRATTVHGRAGEVVPGARTQADRGPGEGVVPKPTHQVEETSSRATEPKGARVPTVAELFARTRGQ